MCGCFDWNFQKPWRCYQFLIVIFSKKSRSISSSQKAHSKSFKPFEKLNYADCSTGTSLSEALFFAEHGENMLCTETVLNIKNNFCTQHTNNMFSPCSQLGILIFMYWACNSMNNLLSYCGLVDAKIRASFKNLPVMLHYQAIYNLQFGNLPFPFYSHTLWASTGQNRTIDGAQ